MWWQSSKNSSNQVSMDLFLILTHVDLLMAVTGIIYNKGEM